MQTDFDQRAKLAAKKILKKMRGDETQPQPVDLPVSPDGICIDVFDWTDEADFSAQCKATRERGLNLATELSVQNKDGASMQDATPPAHFEASMGKGLE
jgi:hypothetical protein